MILCQKPSSFPSSPALHHRRHPSGPPQVIVHPTCTPGLLSLAKPPRPAPSRHHLHLQPQRQPRTPRTRLPTQPRNRSPHPAQPSAASPDPVTPTAEPAPKNPVPPQAATPVATPDKSTRGRPQAKHHKDRSHKRLDFPAAYHSHDPTSSNHRIPSQSSVRRTNNRQPSPEQPVSSQAEGPTPSRPTPSHSRSLSLRNSLNPNVNPFDPFLVTSGSDSDSSSESTQPKSIPLQPAPQLLTPPSKPNRRQPIPSLAPSPTPPSRRIPVPRSNHRAFENISRSDPVLSHMPLRPKQAVVEWDSFPVCDDMTIDDDELPSTPIRTGRTRDGGWEPSFHSPPRSAPLSGRSGFPSSSLSSPLSSPLVLAFTAALRARVSSTCPST